MFDMHSHFKTPDAVFFTAELLPQNIEFPFDPVLVSSSEIGLDRRFEKRVSLEKQKDTLKVLLEYAKQNNVPVCLHCVHADGAMLEILEGAGLGRMRAVWHGFSGSAETAARLCKLGVIISVGRAGEKKIAQLYNANPLLTIETDYTGCDAAEYNSLISELYERCAGRLGMSVCELEERCSETGKAFTHGNNSGF